MKHQAQTAKTDVDAANLQLKHLNSQLRELRPKATQAKAENAGLWKSLETTDKSLAKLKVRVARMTDIPKSND